MPTKFLETGTVLDWEPVRDGLFILRFRSPEIARHSVPGQFIHTRITTGTDPLLRRPFSIQNAVGDTVEILVKSVGRGSAKLRELRVGDLIDNLGPVGSPWRIPDDATCVVGVSGGVGAAPVLFLQDQIGGHFPFYHFVGSRTANDIPFTDAALNHHRIQLATDDGSVGYHGTVIDLLESERNEIDLGKRPFFVTCGPWVMMKALQNWVAKFGYRGQLSAEARMGCAVGVCQGCALAKPGEPRQYVLCCKEGPIFDFGAIDMEVNPFGN